MGVGVPVQTQPEDKSTTLTRAIGNMTGWLGSFPAIVLSFVPVAAWFVGVDFVADHFANNTYQLVINTGTTIITFWMVFIIQNTQNRDGRAIQAKLDARAKCYDASPNSSRSMTMRHFSLAPSVLKTLPRRSSRTTRISYAGRPLTLASTGSSTTPRDDSGLTPTRSSRAFGMCAAMRYGGKRLGTWASSSVARRPFHVLA